MQVTVATMSAHHWKWYTSSPLTSLKPIKLREYDEGSTVLTLAEELEDSINEKMEGQASFSANPDEAIAIAMQQRELAKYSKTRKKTEVCGVWGVSVCKICRAGNICLRHTT